MKYNKYHIDATNFEEWKVKNENILDRCVFDSSWRWETYTGKHTHPEYKYYSGSIYISTIKIDESDEPITDSYYLNKNKEFFNRYECQKQIGYWMSELFHQIIDLLRANNLNNNSGMKIDQNCYVWSSFTNIQTIKAIQELIEKTFSIKTRIHKEGKNEYAIYMHTDEAILNSIQLTSVSTKKEIRKPKQVSKAAKLEKIAKSMNMSIEDVFKLFKKFEKL